MANWVILLAPALVVVRAPTMSSPVGCHWSLLPPKRVELRSSFRQLGSCDPGQSPCPRISFQSRSAPVMGDREQTSRRATDANAALVAFPPPTTLQLPPWDPQVFVLSPPVP